MKKILKIITAISLLFLLIGIVSAFEISDLNTLEDYTEWDNNGYSNYTTNSDRYFLVEKIYSFDDDFKDEWFNDHPEWDFKVDSIGDNIFYFEDDNFEFYGYQEVVEIDGDNYMISINQNSHLSPGEKNLYLENLKEFNERNHLEPIEI